MNEFLFGLHRGMLTDAEHARRTRIARDHRISYVRAYLPSEGHRSWFSGPNLGEPFNGALRDAVLAVVNAEVAR